MMELYTLRLGAPLTWTRVPPAPTAEAGRSNLAPVLPPLARDGAEAVFIWTRNQLVADDEDGPRLLSPLPQPLHTGSSELHGVGTDGAGKIVLPAGSYKFCQGRLNDTASIEQTLEWFFREAWWTRTSLRDPVYVRLIREDGKTAVQVIAESAGME